MAKEPLIPEALIELWLENPVTKRYLSCLEYRRLDIRDAAGNGERVDSGNADLTHAILHRDLGQQDAFTEAQDPESIFEHYGLVQRPEPEPPPEEIPPDA